MSEYMCVNIAEYFVRFTLFPQTPGVDNVKWMKFIKMLFPHSSSEHLNELDLLFQKFRPLGQRQLGFGSEFQQLLFASAGNPASLLAWFHLGLTSSTLSSRFVPLGVLTIGCNKMNILFTISTTFISRSILQTYSDI